MRTTDSTEQHASASYVARVNRAIDHILADLSRPLRLEEVAAVAGFSAFHFHRIFKALMGETLSQFVKRQRLERALYRMSHEPRRRLTEIALDCGFPSSSEFSRSFKQHYGSAPSAFDLKAFRTRRRHEFEQIAPPTAESLKLRALPPGSNPDGFEVNVRDLPARTVAYLRVPDPYREGVVQAAAESLLSWADARGLADGQWLGYMWDEPEIVALAQCRYDVAVVVDEIETNGEIGRFDFRPMRVAEVVIRGDIALEVRALDWLYTDWLPRSGYVPDNLPCFESWIGRPFAHGNTYFELACQLPIRRG